MAPKPSFETMCFNPFLTNDSLNDSNQNPDANFYNNISSLKSNYLSPSEIDKKIQEFLYRIIFCSPPEHQKYEQKFRSFSRFLQVLKH